MKLIDQKTKAIMEECKVRAKDAGLSFDNETLEYIVTNKDMLDLSPKVMIPTLYDYWVHDVEVLKQYGKYKLYPNNPYETVINTRPAISFYNDNNPDWMNIMIFYHVLGHIDFFQNSILFEHTWNDDFAGQALADKRLIESLRSRHGRWVDYSLEFARSIDNITGYFHGLSRNNIPAEKMPEDKLSYYFDVFLQEEKKLSTNNIYKEISRYNALHDQNPDMAGSMFFSDVKNKYPEFEALYTESRKSEKKEYIDLMQFLLDNSPILNFRKNAWMKSVMAVVRNTSLYFAPQIRSKICNEGWASYWHDKLFRMDDRIKGHEVGYARLNAGVTSISRVGLNPYAIGLRLLQYIEDLADKGKLNYRYQILRNSEKRDNYNTNAGLGKDAIFDIRNSFTDFMLINTFVDQDFVDMHNLFVVGQRFNQQRQTVEYYVKSRKAEDYKKMLIDSLYHPPVIEVDESKSDGEKLYLKHQFEGKQLIKDFVPDVLLGIEYLWGAEVSLETTEIVLKRPSTPDGQAQKELRPVLYTMKGRKVSKKNL